MTDRELWERARADACVQGSSYDTWTFGCDADLLAALVLSGEKTATASAHALYEAEGVPLPKAGGYSVILDANDQAVCVIRTNRVSVVPFCEVSAAHALMEGEGDKSLAYWQTVHRAFFTEELRSIGLSFSDKILVVCEEFELVYPVR